MKLFNKKAAMFGLDARIALAIFGALSVISGAALYSAIQSAKVTALVAQMNQLGKAWEQYYLDTGTNLPQITTADNTHPDFYRLKIQNLVLDPSINGWNGPYIDLGISAAHSFTDKNGNIFGALLLTDETAWGGATSWAPDGYCDSTEQCYIYIFYEDKNNSLANTIDKKIDNGNGLQSGIFRSWTPAADNQRYMLKYAPIKNPNS